MSAKLLVLKVHGNWDGHDLIRESKCILKNETGKKIIKVQLTSLSFPNVDVKLTQSTRFFVPPFLSLLNSQYYPLPQLWVIGNLY